MISQFNAWLFTFFYARLGQKTRNLISDRQKRELAKLQNTEEM